MTKVRSLFTLSHRGSHNSLLIFKDHSVEKLKYRAETHV